MLMLSMALATSVFEEEETTAEEEDAEEKEEKVEDREEKSMERSRRGTKRRVGGGRGEKQTENGNTWMEKREGEVEEERLDL